MVVGKSPEWLPPGFVEKVKYKNGRKIRYYLNVETGTKYNSKKDVIGATIDYGEIVTPQKESNDDNVLSSDNRINAISVKSSDSPAWLPNGWKVEEKRRHRGSSKGSVYKVYTDLSRGSKFYSKAAVIRYLNTLDHANTMTVYDEADNVDEPNVIDPNVDQPIVDNPNVDSHNVNDPIVDEPSIELSPQPGSLTNTGGTNRRGRKDKFVMVAIESTTDVDLPPGWIKEIKTSKCGDRIRKDPYYTDPVSGYVFRSKLDAFRYLKTNDIRKCACKPMKRVLDSDKLIENEIPSSNPANETVPKRQHLLGGKESSCAKVLAESEAQVSEQKHGNSESDCVKVTSFFEEKISSANLEKNAEMVNNPVPVDVFTSPETDPLTKQQLSESAKRTKVGSSKPKKRKNISLPSRTSRRLAGSQPEIASNLDLNERSLRASARKSFAGEVDKHPDDSTVIPMPSEIEPSKESEGQAFLGEETHQDPLIDIENLFNDVENPSTECPAITEEQLGGEASEKQIDESKQLEDSQLCYDFGDSWSDPLEFALKTLRGELSIDDTLTFPNSFNEQISIPYNVDGSLKQSQSGAPVQNEFASPSGSSKPQSGTADYLPGNLSSFPAFGSNECSIGWYNCTSSTDVGKKDSQTKQNP